MSESKRVRRTREEILREYEEKAERMRVQVSRSQAVKASKEVRKLLSTAGALRSLAKSFNVFDSAGIMTVASDLERHADTLIGQHRLDHEVKIEENPL